jgi:hypothetical protein
LAEGCLNVADYQRKTLRIMASAQHQIAAYESWAQTEDWSARTAKARRAADNRFLAQNGDDPKRAEAARKAFYKRMQEKSLKVRRAKKAAREAAGETTIVHGTRSGYRRGCRCDACTEAESRYQREYLARRRAAQAEQLDGGAA